MLPTIDLPRPTSTCIGHSRETEVPARAQGIVIKAIGAQIHQTKVRMGNTKLGDVLNARAPAAQTLNVLVVAVVAALYQSKSKLI
jgi:hypothetical protein